MGVAESELGFARTVMGVALFPAGSCPQRDGPSPIPCGFVDAA